MSTVRANTILDAAGGNTATINSMTPTAQSLQGFRNRIINGDMRIDQRNAGAVVTSNNSGQFGVDRFLTEAYGGGTISSQRSTVAPAGFTNSLLLTVTGTDTSLGTTDDYELNQKIEGFNFADLGWGTSAAQSATLSFWVRSSVATTYSVGFQNSDASRSYVATYTVNATNTWEQKTITVTGDTTGTWATNNSTGLFIRWCMATGTNRIAAAANTWESANRIAISSTANPIMGTNGATFYITGVQLEAGSVATPFERRPYGTELALCQRYYEKSYNLDVAVGTSASTPGAVIFNGSCDGSGILYLPVTFKVTKRSTAPTITLYNTSTGSTLTWGYSRSGASGDGSASVGWMGYSGFFVSIATGGTWVTAQTNGHWTASSEL